MPLSARVQARYGAQLLVNLTNPQQPAATILDQTRLDNAAADVEADFEIYAGVVYDDTDDRHIAVGVEGVIAKLIAYTGQADAREAYERFLERLRDLGRVTARDRVTPKSKSELEPTREKAGTETVRPAFDDRYFEDLIPDSPSRSLLGED